MKLERRDTVACNSGYKSTDNSGPIATSISNFSHEPLYLFRKFVKTKTVNLRDGKPSVNYVECVAMIAHIQTG